MHEKDRYVYAVYIKTSHRQKEGNVLRTRVFIIAKIKPTYSQAYPLFIPIVPDMVAISPSVSETAILISYFLCAPILSKFFVVWWDHMTELTNEQNHTTAGMGSPALFPYHHEHNGLVLR